MNIEIKLNFTVILIFSLSYLCLWQVKALERRGYRTNLQTVRRKASYSYPKIIFDDDNDDEPLVPIPTFPTPTKSSAIGDSITSSYKQELQTPSTKRPKLTSQSSIIDKIRVGSKNEAIGMKPLSPVPVTKQPTRKITVDMKKRVSEGSGKQPDMKPRRNQKDRTKLIPDNLEEPILEGSYYVPFKKMRNSTS